MHKKTSKLLTLILAVLLALSVLTGCTTDTTTAITTTETVGTAAGSTSIQTEYAPEDLDTSWDAATATAVTLDGDSVTVEGTGATVKGSDLNVTAAGTYVISGTLTDGQIIVDAGKDDLVRLVLNGAAITSLDSAPILSKQAEKTILILAEGSSNSIQDGTATVASGEDTPDGAIFSQDDLTISGTGSLTVNGVNNHGIISKDDLVITGGSLTIDSAKDGIHSNNRILIQSGTIDIVSGDDGIHADDALTIDGGTIRISESYEGLESAEITVNGGTIDITALDDGINAAGSLNPDSPYFIRIAGGTIIITAEGDGIDANGSLYFSGGTVLVNGPVGNGNGAMDYDGVCEVTGGTLVIAGSSGMAQSPGESSTQNSLTVIYGEAQAAGTLATLTDESGKVILAYAPAKKYQSILISSSEIEQGKTYTLTSGGTNSSEAANGLFTGGTTSGAKLLTEITISKAVTRIADDGSEASSGMQGPGGPKGQGKPGSPPALPDSRTPEQ